jgi:hypothetical protein
MYQVMHHAASEPMHMQRCVCRLGDSSILNGYLASPRLDLMLAVLLPPSASLTTRTSFYAQLGTAQTTQIGVSVSNAFALPLATGGSMCHNAATAPSPSLRRDVGEQRCRQPVLQVPSLIAHLLPLPRLLLLVD